MFAIIFDSAAVVKPSTFASDLFPAAVSRPAEPARKSIIVEARRTREDEPDDEDRLEWYSNGEVRRWTNAQLASIAEAEWRSVPPEVESIA